MTPRERVLAALNFKVPDKIPTEFGSTNCTTIAKKGYAEVKKMLGVDKPDVLLMEDFQLSVVDEEVLQMLDTDLRGVPGKPHFYDKKVIDENIYYDHFGIKYLMPENGLYFDMVENPLADMETLAEIKDNYEWPEPINPKVVEGLGEQAKKLKEENKYAIVGDMVNTGIFEPSHYLRGFEDFLMDLMINEDIACYILEEMLAYQSKRYEAYLNEVGEYLDVVFVGDDLASTQTTLISPQLYRDMVKPYQKEYFKFIKSKTNAKLLYHSCGNVTPLIEDLIEIGVDILNPIQVNANDMDTKMLKERYGDRLCFLGAIDTNKVLPEGSVQDVRDEVERRIEDLGPCGYILAAVHDIQVDVPPENVIEMYRAAKAYKL
ncbi:MAG: uroporphyrinogen decarboxylase family protein [Christensenellales bacterium]